MSLKRELKSLHFDESGFTGYNLLDPDQPIFSIGSHDLTDLEAFELLRRSFPNYKGEEFKFSRIWSRERSRRELINFSEYLSNYIERCFVYTCDKRFVTFTKVVDNLVEPVVHAAGQDFYADGYNVKFSNMAHFAFSQFSTDEFYADLLERYQSFSRSPSVETLVAMQRRYTEMASNCPEEVKRFMSIITMGALEFERHSRIEKHKGSSDIHLTTMVSSIGFWRSKFEEDFKVIHDESAHFFRQREMWERITSMNAAERIIHADDERKVIFPLRVTETVQVDSRGSPALQLSDLISGLGAKSKAPLLNTDDQALINEILHSGLGEMNAGGLHPGTSFIDSPPRELDGPDAIDQFRELMFPDSSEA